MIGTSIAYFIVMKDALNNYNRAGGYLITSHNHAVVIGQVDFVGDMYVTISNLLPAIDNLQVLVVSVLTAGKSLFVRKGIGYKKWSGFTLEHF